MRTKLISLFALSLVITLGARAQSNMVLYNFNAIPQSLHTNPAYPQQAKVWVGLPALSGVSVHFHNNAFKLIDLIERDSDPNANLASIISGLGEGNQLTTNQQIDLLGVGFKTGKGFVSLGATFQVDYMMDYPGNLMRFLYFGNGTSQAEITNLSTFDFEVMSRTNFYLGYQHKFLDDKLSVGARFKYIFGLQHGFIERSNVIINSQNTHVLNVTTDVSVKTAGVSNLTGDNAFDDIMSIAFPNNTGIAFDIGADYKITDRWSVNFSVLDIGSITWNDNNRDYVSQGEFDWDGVTVDLSQDIGNPTEFIGDSLEAAFDFQEIDGNGYTRSLMNQAYLGVNYNLTPKHGFGALYHARVWNGNIFHDYGVNYQGRWSRWFQFIASYSMINGTENNVGAGFDLKLGPVQLYMMSDNILGAIMYENLQTTNLRFGINLTFYGKKKPKAPEFTPATEGREPLPNPSNSNE